MAAPLSQLGHLLAYLVRYWPSGWSHESFGTHAYFPTMAGTSAGLLGLVVLATLAVVGLARLLVGRRHSSRRRTRGAALADLVAVLLPLQLAIFVTQETTELVLAGQLHSLADVPILWGLAGQVPVAGLAALFLHWASIAVERAIDRLNVWLDVVVASPRLTPPSPQLAQVLGLAATADGPTAGLERGPPPRLSLRLTAR